MCSIGRTTIPDKHRLFWNGHYNDILKKCGTDQSVFRGLILKIWNMSDYTEYKTW